MRSWLRVVFLVTCGCAPSSEPVRDSDDQGSGDTDAGIQPLAFEPPDAGPTLVEPSSEGPDGLILDRVVALLANDVDAAGFEAALGAVQGTVASSRPGLRWLTVSIPPVADLAGAQAVADRLAAQPGIRSARPAWLARPATLPGPVRAAPAPIELDGNPSLGTQRFFAAWGVSSLATDKVPVYVGDFFTQLSPVAQLPRQRFVGAQLPILQQTDPDGTYAGNHGFWVSSLLGAELDGRAPAGTHPDPARTLDLVAVNLLRAGDEVDAWHILDRELPTSGFYVLSTSFGFAEKVPALARAEGALAWREVLLRRAPSFVHLTSSGNEGHTDVASTRLGSATAAQAQVDDLRTLLTGDDLDDFASTWEEAVDRHGAAIGKVVGHTLVVGASDGSGIETAFSNRGGEVRMIGVDLTGSCARKDADCADTPFGLLMEENGTSGSTPVAAGLAAWLRALDPTLDAAAVRARLLAAFDGHWVDALTATLALEKPGLPIRRTLLDQDGNGTFDDADVLAAAVALVEGDAADRAAPPTWPRADLNGDGRVRSDTRAPFDLDGDGTLGSISVTVPGAQKGTTETLTLDEAEASDRDVLCWAAYGGLIPGASEDRDALLRETCQPLRRATELAEGMVFEGGITFDYTVDNLQCRQPTNPGCDASRQTNSVESVTISDLRVELVYDVSAEESGVVGTANVTTAETVESRNSPLCTEDRGSVETGSSTSDLAGSFWYPDSLTIEVTIPTTRQEDFQSYGGVNFGGAPCVPSTNPPTDDVFNDDYLSTELLFDGAGNVVGVSFVLEEVIDNVDADGFGIFRTRTQLGTLRRTR